MEKFAFIIHPIKARDVARKYPIARFVPDRLIEAYIKGRDPVVAAHVTGIRSATGEEAEGWFIGCPFTPRQFLSLPLDFVYDKLEKCGRLAEELGAKIIGLGAFTSVVGDGGVTLSKRLKIAVTTGNSYTVATAVEGSIKAAGLMGISLPAANVAVIGATGSIGATCAEILARDAREVGLIGRSPEKLAALAARLKPHARASINVYTDVAQGLRDADIIITVSSAAEAIVKPEHIKRGAVVCDVARPRDVSVAVQKERDDVLVIEGGVVRVPGDMHSRNMKNDTPFSFGFPQGTAYACMSETIALALEHRYENFTLGKEVTVQQVDEISAICRRHGFQIDGFRSFERAVSDEEIARIRARSGQDAPEAPHPLATGTAIEPEA
jgi:predicted amino acid dehydrogenase